MLAAVPRATQSLDSETDIGLSCHRKTLLEQGDGDVATDVTETQREGIFRRLGASLPTPRGMCTP